MYVATTTTATLEFGDYFFREGTFVPTLSLDYGDGAAAAAASAPFGRSVRSPPVFGFAKIGIRAEKSHTHTLSYRQERECAAAVSIDYG